MNYYRQYVGLLLQVIYFTANCLAENVIININDKKPIAVTSNAFLSFTLDPAILLHSTDTLTKNIERSTNMARGLVPAYIRLGGPQCNSYIFERTYSHNTDVDSNDTLFAKQWTLIHQWAKNVGLDIIVCIAPRYIENESKMHSKNSINMTELLSFNDLMGYNVSWQLGYECQTKCNLSGGDLGQYVASFREMLKTFPRYSNSLITGPDIVAYKTAQQQKYLQDYLNSADTALSAITWHPDFASISLNNDSISINYDNMVADKNELYKIISRDMTRKKPLWIAESKPEKFKHEYLGALIWTTRLGNAAKLGIQVIMRQPSNFYKATPDYWVSLLHKTLVGRQVLELRLQSNNESYVHLYSQCTKPSALYDKGAITIFGVNLTPKEMTANLKGLKIKTLHKYILSPDTKTGNKMFSEKVLLNNKPLDLINDKKLPNIEPEIIIKPDGLELKLSSGNIGFWVIPNAKVKACVYSEKEMTESIAEKKLSKQHKNIIEQDNQEKKIDDMKNYQHSTQESERMKRDIGKKLIEMGLKKDNIFKKHSRFDNTKDYINERKTKRKGGDEFKRDELLIPFNPRTTDSGENNFYGFSRHNPIKGFPESDIFITTGDSSEQNYDYVQDESNEKDSILKNMQHRKDLTHKHIEDNTWIEMENDHIPNEFFENVKFNTRIKGNPKNYGDLLEAEFFPQEHENIGDNNKIAAVKIPQEQLAEEKEEKQAIEGSMQKLANYYDLKEHDRDTKYKALGLALRRSTMPFNQLVKTPIYINHQATNTKPEGTKLKVESEQKALNFFYQPSQTATVNSNYNNYRTKNMKHDASNNRNNINTETIKFSRPADVNMEYSIREIQYPILHNKRFKRSNCANIQKIHSEEMIKENKENTKDCHCRIIQTSYLSKPICYCRSKRDSQILDSSSESVNVGSDQSQINIENSMTKEEHEKIMAGEILPNINVIESDYEEYDITTEIITTESSTLDYKPSYVTQTIDVNSTSIMDTSEVNNISEQYHNVDKFNVTSVLVNSEFFPNNAEDLNNNDTINNDITKMFFRTEPPSIQSENKTTTYDPSQIVYKMSSDNQDIIVSTTEYEQEKIREKAQNLIKEQKTESSTYSTITENQEDEERRDNNYKISLKSTNFLETTKGIAEEQMTTETILSNNNFIKKQITYRTLNNSESSESKTKSKDNVQQSVENTQSIESGAGTQLKENIETKKLKTIFRKTPLKEHARYEEYLNKRAKQINKLKEKLNARREKLLQQYRHQLIENEQKRNLKRREIWEKFYENDHFRHLIDQGEFVSILNDNDIHKDNNNEKYEIPIEFVPKQYENIPNQIYTLAKIKKERYPKYYQFPRHVKITEDNEKSTLTSSDSKYNQYYEHLPKIIKNEQELAEVPRFSDHKDHQDCRYSEKIIEEQESSAPSKSYNYRIFAIDPSSFSYRGGDTILQLHDNHSKLPKYYSKIKLESQNSIPKWMLEKIYQILSKSTFSEDQHQTSKLQEYMKKTSIKNDQKNANAVYIFDIHKQHDRPNDIARFAQIWSNSLNRRNIDQTINNTTADELNNIYKDLETKHGNLNMPITDRKMELAKDVKIGEYVKNEKFINSHEKEDILNVEKTEDTYTEKIITPKNIDIHKEETLNIRKFNKNIAESEYKTAHLNNKRKNIAKNIFQIAKDTQEINEFYDSNKVIQNDINNEMANNNNAVKDVEKIIDNDSELSKLETGNARTRRNIRSDEHLERLLYFLLTRTNTQDGSNYDIYDHLKEDSEEILSNQPILFYLLTKNDESPLNKIQFQKLKNYLTSSQKNLEINQQDEKEYKSTKCIVFIPTKDSYKMLEVKDDEDSLESSEIPYSESQYLARKILDSIIRYSDDEFSEELVYEDLSDLLNENIPDKEVYSSESMQDVSIHVKDRGINHESEKKDEHKNEKIKYLEMKDQIPSGKCGMLFPSKENEKRRQRREIKNKIIAGINQIGGEVIILLTQ
ncbi:Heparanase [Camponotus japonicus]